MLILPKHDRMWKENIVGNYTNGGYKGNLSDLGNETTFSGIEGYADENEGIYVFSYVITNA